MGAARTSCAQLFCNLSDPALEDALYDSVAVQRFGADRACLTGGPRSLPKHGNSVRLTEHGAHRRPSAPTAQPDPAAAPRSAGPPGSTWPTTLPTSRLRPRYAPYRAMAAATARTNRPDGQDSSTPMPPARSRRARWPASWKKTWPSGCSRPAIPPATLCEFRRRHLADFAILPGGGATGARTGAGRTGGAGRDGTKLRANASKRKAMGPDAAG